MPPPPVMGMHREEHKGDTITVGQRRKGLAQGMMLGLHRPGRDGLATRATRTRSVIKGARTSRLAVVGETLDDDPIAMAASLRIIT